MGKKLKKKKENDVCTNVLRTSFAIIFPNFLLFHFLVVLRNFPVGFRVLVYAIHMYFTATQKLIFSYILVALMGTDFKDHGDEYLFYQV